MDRATSEVETWFPDSFLFCGKLLTTLCFFLDSFWVFSIELNWFRNDDNANDDGSSGLEKKNKCCYIVANRQWYKILSVLWTSGLNIEWIFWNAVYIMILVATNAKRKFRDDRFQ